MEFSGMDMALSPEQLTNLSMEADPTQILVELQQKQMQQIQQDAAFGMTTPETKTYNSTYNSILNPSQKVGGGPAPFDPKSLAMLQSMMPKPPQQAHFIGAGSSRPATAINLQLPEMANMFKSQSNQGPRAPTLAQLLGGR